MGMTSRWDNRFLMLAKHISQWSKDPSTKVGCCVVDDGRIVRSLGYNGLPRGIDDTEDRLANRGVKYNLTLHAEENTLLFARQPLDGCTIYVWPMLPCSRCAAKIIQAGITRVVAAHPDTDTAERWMDDWILAEQMYREAGVKSEVLE